MVLMGGAGPGAPNSSDGGRYDDTWELVPAPLTLSIDPGAVRPFCRNEPLILPAYPTVGRLLSYQWFWDGGGLHVGNPILAGQTNQTLNLPPATAAIEFAPTGLPIPDPQLGHRKFILVATDQCANQFRLELEVDVHIAPVIFNRTRIRPDRADQFDTTDTIYRCPGQTLTLALPVDGSSVLLDAASPPLPATYKWFFNGEPGLQDPKVGNWYPNYAAAQPPPRFDHAMAYDRARGRTVLFGGRPTIRIASYR